MKEFDLLVDIVEDLTGVTREELVSKKRLRTLVELRMACSIVLRDYSQRNGKKLTVFELGDMLNIDHSSVSYYSASHYKLIGDLKSGRNYRTLYEQIKSSFDIRAISINKDSMKVLLEKKNSLENELEMVNGILFNMKNT